MYRNNTQERRANNKAKIQTLHTKHHESPSKKQRLEKNENKVSSLHSKPTQVLEKSCFLEDFKCSVCLDLLFEPVSLSCGHTFCKVCTLGLSSSECPLCKTVSCYLPCLKVNIIMLTMIQKMLEKEYALRQKQRNEELSHYAKEASLELSGGKILTYSQLYEALKARHERQGDESKSFPSEQQFLYLLCKMRKEGQIGVLKGRPYLCFDANYFDGSKLMKELRHAQEFLVSEARGRYEEEKWQQNWCEMVLHGLKRLDKAFYAEAKESMDRFFPSLTRLDELDEGCAYTEVPSFGTYEDERYLSSPVYSPSSPPYESYLSPSRAVYNRERTSHRRSSPGYTYFS